tara:strand:- start:53 stop:331 length:279 start_codon:yes stop_codon:yes gene_type:complete
MGMESNFTDLKTRTMEITDEQIKELKTLLWILDSKHSVSVPQTQENINYISDEIVKLFSIPDVVSMSKCCNADCKKPTASPDGVYCEFHRSM